MRKKPQPTMAHWLTEIINSATSSYCQTDEGYIERLEFSGGSAILFYPQGSHMFLMGIHRDWIADLKEKEKKKAQRVLDEDEYPNDLDEEEEEIPHEFRYVDMTDRKQKRYSYPKPKAKGDQK